MLYTTQYGLKKVYFFFACVTFIVPVLSDNVPVHKVIPILF